MKRLLVLVLLLLIVPLLASCREEEKADIYVSVYPLQYLAESIVKDNMKVKSFFPFGTNIHDYEPSPSLIINMASSKAIFYIGAGLEAFIEKAAGNTLSDDILVEMSKYVTMIEPGGSNAYRGEDLHDHPVDPHIWLDPNRMIVMAEKVYEKVCAIMPEKVEEFTANKVAVVDKLEKLDRDFKEMLSDETISEKVIVVDHDAYLYWEDAYQIKRIKTRLDNDSCTVIPTDFIKNIEAIKEANIKYIVTTSNESACDIVGQYVQEAKLNKEILYGIESISKNLYKEGKDYIFFMNENIRVLGKILPRKS